MQLPLFIKANKYFTSNQSNENPLDFRRYKSNTFKNIKQRQTKHAQQHRMKKQIPAKIIKKIIDFACHYLIKLENNIKTGSQLKIRGKPILQVHDEANLTIGNNVTLNSRNFGYHANMHSPVKLMADSCGAKIVIGNNTRLNGCCVHAKREIKIGNNCLIAANVHIFDSNGHDSSLENPSNRINTTGHAKPIHIEDNVWIGLNSIILPGVKIGEGSVVGANSVVAHDIPPFVIFAGNPGRVIKKITPSSASVP